jgi:hypothetical protein
LSIDSTSIKAHRSASGGKGGEHEQAIGRSRGGRTTKIRALGEPDCKPCAFHLTPVISLRDKTQILAQGRPF